MGIRLCNWGYFLNSRMGRHLPIGGGSPRKEQTMTEYECADCGKQPGNKRLWVCEDDALRCDGCIDSHIEALHAERMSAVSEHVEGRVGAGR